MLDLLVPAILQQSICRFEDSRYHLSQHSAADHYTNGHRSASTKAGILRHSAADSPSLDRLLRYDTSLERAFDRAPNQLGLLQRMRRGQPVLLEIRVNVSG